MSAKPIDKICLVAWIMLIAPAPTIAGVIYDGSLGTAPSSQGWLYLPVAAQTIGPQGVTLDTTASNAIQTGYSRSDQALDADQGYTLRFDAQLISESHASDHRAGFSVIVVSTDPTRALELGFWTDQVWAHDDAAPVFDSSHDETQAFNTTAAVTRYELTVNAGSYSLTANGAHLLSGAMRNYTAWEPPASFPPTPDVYEIPNFIFLGDDTTSAQASVLLSLVEFTPIPEPASAGLWAMGLIALAHRRGLAYIHPRRDAYPAPDLGKRSGGGGGGFSVGVGLGPVVRGVFRGRWRVAASTSGARFR